jgi:ElaB/YqjD/DUF883 family membrane-anchored ribosome-binding protein
MSAQAQDIGGQEGLLGKLHAGDAEKVIEQTRAAMDQAVETASDFVRERPILCLAGALAIGYLVGKIVSR